MDVLIFENSEYRLTISTASIEYAWERFERRVKDAAPRYCDYRSSARENFLCIIRLAITGTSRV